MSRTCAFVEAMASAHWLVAVATPDKWPSKFSAVRSAVSNPRVGPSTLATRVPGSTRAPSATNCVNTTFSAPHTMSKTAPAIAKPAMQPVCRDAKTPALRCFAGTVEFVVTSGPLCKSSSRATEISRRTASMSKPAAVMRCADSSESLWCNMITPRSEFH